MHMCKIIYKDGREKTFSCYIWEAENGVVSFGCGTDKNPWSSTFNVPLDIIDSFAVRKTPATKDEEICPICKGGGRWNNWPWSGMCESCNGTGSFRYSSKEINHGSTPQKDSEK